MRKATIATCIALTGLLLPAGVGAQSLAGTSADPTIESSAGEITATNEGEASAVTPPPGQTARYVIPYYTSQTLLPGARSTTMVDVYNQSSIPCDVGVQFQFAFGTTNICSITLTIPPKQSRLFCSRIVNDPLYPCTISCPGAGLLFNTGHSFVTSLADRENDCARIAVHAQLAFTRDINDDLVEGTTRLTVVEINDGNEGD